MEIRADIHPTVEMFSLTATCHNSQNEVICDHLVIMIGYPVHIAICALKRQCLFKKTDFVHHKVHAYTFDFYVSTGLAQKI